MVVPGNWKNHGYKDYNGIAWYRKKVSIPEEYQNQKMAFIIGRIENCDEVYINGEIVGNTGIIPVVKKKQQGDPVKADESVISEDCYKVRIYYLPEKYFFG
jgi:sialate O-acetylesterase